MMEYRCGDVVFVDIPNAIGHQQGGKRFGVIVTNNKGNHFSPCVGIITGTTKRNDSHQPTHAHYTISELPFLKKDTTFCAENFWTINKEQILFVAGRMNESQLERLSLALLNSMPVVISSLRNNSESE